MGRGSVRDFGNPAPQMPAETRIPAPLAAPQQAPVINGPMSQPSLRLRGAGRTVDCPAPAFCGTAHEPSPGSRPAGDCAKFSLERLS
jgi:hypothetical protein